MIFLLLILIYVLCRASCEAVIDRYYWNSAPPFVGFNTELDARSSFKSFQTFKQLPPGIRFPTSVQPLNGPPMLLLPQTPQHRNKPSTSQSPVSPSPNSLPSPALSGPAVQSGLSSTHYLAAMPLPLSAHLDVNLKFYAVIEGDAPGVYGSQ